MSNNGQHVPAAASVEVDRLYYHYGDGTEAVKTVSFSVAAGECVGLVGPNGAGKSTLLLHLNGLLPDSPDGTGRVSIGGVLIEKKTLAEVRRRVGLLFQDPDDQLFCPSVYEDVAFGPEQFGLPRDKIGEIVKTSLESVGLAGFEKRSPHRLSGGEKRRVCLAGVLACGPSVLALDEPTSNLDPRGRREFINLLRTLPATKIIATHDLDMVVDLCDRAIVIDGGEVVAQGPPREVLSDDDLMLAHGLERPLSLSEAERTRQGEEPTVAGNDGVATHSQRGA